MKNKLKRELLKNKNDLIDGTFCYVLFEKSIFDINLMESLIEKGMEYRLYVENDSDIKSLFMWINDCIEQCIVSHHDKDDYFIINNYTPDIEEKWRTIWKPSIIYLAGGS